MRKLLNVFLLSVGSDDTNGIPRGLPLDARSADAVFQHLARHDQHNGWSNYPINEGKGKDFP